jgi:hypothetical protein
MTTTWPEDSAPRRVLRPAAVVGTRITLAWVPAARPRVQFADFYTCSARLSIHLLHLNSLIFFGLLSFLFDSFVRESYPNLSKLISPRHLYAPITALNHISLASSCFVSFFISYKKHLMLHSFLAIVCLLGDFHPLSSFPCTVLIFSSKTKECLTVGL